MSGEEHDTQILNPLSNLTCTHPQFLKGRRDFQKENRQPWEMEELPRISTLDIPPTNQSNTTDPIDHQPPISTWPDTVHPPPNFCLTRTDHHMHKAYQSYCPVNLYHRTSHILIFFLKIIEYNPAFVQRATANYYTNSIKTHTWINKSTDELIKTHTA